MLAIVALSLGLVLLSQGADRIFNPRVRARRASTIEDAAPTGGEN
jgi:peptide/nickel transport system permease protein